MKYCFKTHFIQNNCKYMLKTIKYRDILMSLLRRGGVSMRTTISITMDVNLAREVKVYCAMNDKKVSGYLEEIVKADLEKQKEKEQ